MEASQHFSRKVLLLLCIAGLACALQYPLQYRYQYRARVSTGAPEVSSRQSATSAIKADVNVYATGLRSLMFNLENVKTGDFHGVSDCDGDFGGGLSIEYSTPTDEPGSLIGRYPFGVQDGSLTFHANEKQWVMNFYKSIVSLFSTQPMKETFFGENGNYSGQSAAYRVEEDTIMGRCPVTYTQQKLSGVDASRHEGVARDQITDDVQSKEPSSGAYRKTSGQKSGRYSATETPTIDGTVWKIVRTVNLEDCSDPVEHQKTLQGISCKMADGQCGNMYSRNSQGIYILRGDENAYRIENAIVSGAVQVSPYGYTTERIINLSKQTLSLVSVRNLGNDVPEFGSSKTAKNLIYEMTLVYEGLPNPYSWVKLGSVQDVFYELTGRRPTASSRADNDEAVLNMIQLAYQEIEGISIEGVSRAPAMLSFAANMLYDYTEYEINHLVDLAKQRLTPETLVLFYNVLTNTGTEPAIRAVLEGINAGKVTAVNQVAFFGSLNINLKSPSAMRPILDFLKSEDVDKTPYKTTQSLLNFASLVRRVCIDDGMPDHSYAVFYKEQCRRDNIVAELEQLLIAQLESTTKFWKQMTMARALVNLNTVSSTNALLPYVLGTKDCDSMVRVVALESLAQWQKAPQYQEKITLILLDIFENPAESRLLRARALNYLSSWPLSSSDWARLAFFTQRSTNKDLAAFTYSLINAVSNYEEPSLIQQRSMALHALTLAKPSSPARRYSGFINYMRYNFGDQIGISSEAYVLWDPMSPIPTEMHYLFRKSLSDVKLYYRSETVFSGDDGNLDNIARELFLGQRPERTSSSSSGEAARLLDTLRGGLDIVEGIRGPITGFFQEYPIAGMDYLVPCDYEILIDLLKATSPSRTAYDLVFEGPSLMYGNQMDNFFVTVNDLGMRVILSLTFPTVFYMKGSMRFAKTGDYKYSMQSEGLGVMAASSLDVYTETVVPWSRSNVAAGVSFASTYQSPLNVDYDQLLKNENSPESSLRVSVKQTSSGRVSLISLANEPFTLLGPTTAENFNGFADTAKLIRDNNVDPEDNKWIQNLPSETYVAWTGDIPPMGKQVFEMVYYAPGSYVKRGISPSLRLWTYDWTKDFLPSDNDSEFVFTMTQSYADAVEAKEPSKGAYSYSQRQSTEATARPSEGFGDVTENSLGNIFKFLQSSAGWSNRVDGVSARAEVRTRDEVTVMDVTVAQTLTDASDGQQRKNVVVGLSMKDDPCFTTCIELETLRPKFSNMDTIASLKNKNLNKTGTYTIYAGPNCKDGPVSITQETRSLSEGVYSSLFRNLESCGSPATDPVAELAREALYDVVQIRDEYFKDEDVKLTCGENTLLSFARSYYQDLYKGYMPPGLVPSPCRAADDAKVIYATGRKDARNSDFWTVSYSFDSKKETTEKPLKVPESVDRFLNDVSMVFDYDPAPQCVISTSRLVSFDGLSTDCAIDTCPTLAATSCEAGESDSFAVAVKTNSDGSLAVNVAAVDKQLVLTMDADGIELNGRAIESGFGEKELYFDGKIVGRIYGQNGVYKIDIVDTVQVVYKERRIYIEVATRYNGFTCGLCGNKDNEPYNDMKRPNGCLTSSIENFRKSWIPSSSYSCKNSDSGPDADSCLKEDAPPKDYYVQYQI